MTLAELLQSCVSLQQANVEFMKRLDEKMCREYAGYSSVLTNNPKCLVSQQQQQQQEPTCRVLVEMATPSWQPLEQVVETDNETDATTTPGSSAFLSPPLSATSQPQQGGTPVTPSLDHLQLRYVILVWLDDLFILYNLWLFLYVKVPTRRQSCIKKHLWRNKKILSLVQMISLVLLPNDTAWMPLKPGEHTGIALEQRWKSYLS